MDTEVPTPEKLYYYRFGCGGLSIQQAADLVGVSKRTYRRWELGKAPIRLAAFRLIKLAASGYLPDPAWQDWRFYQGALYSPERVKFMPGEIRALPYLHALIAELRSVQNDGHHILDLTPATTFLAGMP